MQGGEFDGYAWAIRQRLVAGGAADGGDRGGVAGLIALRILGGAGALAQHVETVAEYPAGPAAGAGQRFLDRLAQHEMAAHDAHRLAHGRADGGQAEAAHHAFEDTLRRVLRPDQPRRQAQRPGAGIDQHGVGLVPAGGEPALAQFILDQPVGGGVVRHAQQTFGEHHQRQTFRRGEAVFAQQRLDTANAAGASADGADQAAGFRVDPRLPFGG